MGLFVKRGGDDSRRKWRISGFILAVLCFATLLIAVSSIYYGVVGQKSLYMLNYQEEIAMYSEKYELDPHLISAMIYCESTFKSDAVSSVGATGLMQIMPDTGEWLAGKLGIKNYTKSMLLRPSVNIEMGCYYMKFLSDRYDGDIRCAVAAYHCGQGKVDGWLRDPSISNDGKTLHNIPEGETNKYTGRVEKVWEIYRKLYADAFITNE